MAASLFLCFLVVCSTVCLSPSEAGSCLAGWYQHGDSCYAYGDSAVSWGNAEQVCKAFNGMLAEIETAEENTYLKNLAKSKGGLGVWLGGSDVLDEGTWEWVSSGQSISGFTDWRAGQPDEASNDGEDCLQLHRDFNYQWNDHHCDQNFNFICEAEPGQSDILG